MDDVINNDSEGYFVVANSAVNQSYLRYFSTYVYSS